MASWKQNLYDSSPWRVKEFLVAAEAWQRNRSRRYGDYDQARRDYNFQLYCQLSSEEIRAEQFRRLNAVIAVARHKSNFYQTRLPEVVSTIDALSEVPILTKADIRSNLSSMIAQDYNRTFLWTAYTSGSTGTPLRFSVGREGVRARFAIQDNYYALNGCCYGDRRARFGGSRVVPADCKQPPFWIYNRPDNQLQMSPYHMDNTTLELYVQKLNSFKPKYITGYAHALYLLGQYLCENRNLEVDIQAVFLDSEGIPDHFIPIIENGLYAKVYRVYGLGEVGWVAVQATDGQYHLLDLSCVVEVVDETGQPLPYGERGRIIVTDLTQTAVPYIRYDTGDIGCLLSSSSASNMNTPVLDAIDGRNDDMIVTPSGRKVGRLSHVTKPGKGILESQIAQIAPDRVVIRVVPTSKFDPASMEDVIAVALSLLGSDMKIEWEPVKAIPRTSRHKFKHVVREI